MAEASLHGGMEQRQGVSLAMQKNLRILQASTAELRHIIAEALDGNPVLEEESYEHSSDDWGDTVSGGSDYESASRHDFLMNSLVSAETLQQHLLSQVHTSELSAGTVEALEYLIGSLDDRGYLDSDLEELSESGEIPLSCMEKGLDALRNLDPPGVGAFGLKDSLLIQLRRAGEEGALSYRIVETYFNNEGARTYTLMAKDLGVSMEQIKDAAARILRLNLNPGAPYDREVNQTVSPDMEIVEGDQGFEVHLTKGNLPVLKLSDVYKEILAESADNLEVRKYLKNCFHEARFLKEAIAYREETLQKLGAFIVEREDEFFRFGKGYLKPLGMKEAADFLGVHPATVSRAVSGKYLHCKYGLFELRFFFSSGYESDSGEEVSSHAVREAISALVRDEDGASPLSDSQLADELKKKGLNVARRTVAKYREQLKILPARFRKKD